jgi:hypothetical protein
VGDPSWQLTLYGFGIWSRTDADIVARVMKVHGLLLDRHVGGDERRHDGRIAVDERNRRWFRRL